MSPARTDWWYIERNFEASRTRPPSRESLKGQEGQRARARDDLRKRCAKRTDSARNLRALASVTGLQLIPCTPLTAPLLARRDVRDCQSSCLWRLEKSQHLELRQLLRQVQDDRDRRRGQISDQTLSLEDLLR